VQEIEASLLCFSLELLTSAYSILFTRSLHKWNSLKLMPVNLVKVTNLVSYIDCRLSFLNDRLLFQMRLLFLDRQSVVLVHSDRLC
jgi:hypothetical protein